MERRQSEQEERAGGISGSTLFVICYNYLTTKLFTNS